VLAGRRLEALQETSTAGGDSDEVLCVATDISQETDVQRLVASTGGGTPRKFSAKR
jgi:NADP-dependent 3-hydroxy acid dehydrogenase YdfG